MQISELAQQASVSVHALRHYERLGLIRPDRRANGYRDYPARMRREVVFIAMSRQLGFSLPQIALRLDEYRAGTLGINDMVQALQERVDAIDQQIAVQEGWLARNPHLTMADIYCRWWKWMNQSPANLSLVRLNYEAATLDTKVTGLAGSGPLAIDPAQVIGHQRVLLQPGVIVALHHIQGVLRHVLAGHEPRLVLAAAARCTLVLDAADADALALAQRVEAQAHVLTELAPGDTGAGPAIIEGPFFTARVLPGWTFRVTSAGDLLLNDTL